MKNVELKIGLPLTYYCGTDCYPYEVSEIYSEDHICIRPLDYRVLKGSVCDEDAEIEYISNSTRKPLEIKRYKDGWYSVISNNKARKVKGSRYYIEFGNAKKYCDPSF